MGSGNPIGGSRELARLIDGFGETLIPDLKRYYGIDLRDLFSEDHPLSPRWVLMHINNLPMASAFVAERRGGPQFIGWDENQYMMARLIDLARTQIYLFILAHKDPKKRNPDAPEMYPVPGMADKPKTEPQGKFALMALKGLNASRKTRRGV